MSALASTPFVGLDSTQVAPNAPVSTTLMTQMGPIPVQFPLEAESLDKAFALFPEGVRGAIERLNERAREMAREEASRIMVPGKTPGPGMGGMGGGLGGMGGGRGKFIID